LDADAVHVPAGPCIVGGDPGAPGWDLPRAEPWVEDFIIARHPVTVEQYLEFLDDVGRHDPEEAWRRAPRRSPQGGQYVVRRGDGRLALPGRDAEGDT